MLTFSAVVFLFRRLEQFDKSANVRVAQHHGAAVLYFDDPAIGNSYSAACLRLRINRIQVGHLKADVVDSDIGEVLVEEPPRRALAQIYQPLTNVGGTALDCCRDH